MAHNPRLRVRPRLETKRAVLACHPRTVVGGEGVPATVGVDVGHYDIVGTGEGVVYGDAVHEEVGAVEDIEVGVSVGDVEGVLFGVAKEVLVVTEGWEAGGWGVS